MSQLHFQPLQGMELDIIDAILQTKEVVALDNCQSAIRLVTEELVVNIADYAGSDYLDVETELDEEKITLRFRDGGVPFNPLDMEPPDTSLSLDEREIGGLGIFFVINHMDKVEYEYKNGENILTVSKKLK
jgi:anti-sigma regulatory factor (Ser/Thr protein kinase)